MPFLPKKFNFLIIFLILTQVGSIVFLDQNDICPADLILLDSSEIRDKEAISFVDSQLLSGRTELQRKKCSKLAHSNMKYQSNDNKIKLSCKMEYSQPNTELDSFVGYLKLLNDPKIEKLTNDNFIPSGSIIKKVSWIIGLVVYAGNDTKLMRNVKLKFYKTSFLEYVSQIYFLTIFCILIVCAFVIFSIYYILKY